MPTDPLSLLSYRYNLCVPMKFPTMAQRAWFAYQCLDRDEEGRLPEYRALERSQGLSNNTIRKLLRGELTRPSPPTFRKLAAALRTTTSWLELEEGPGPIARGPVTQYPTTWLKAPKTPLSEEISSLSASEDPVLHISNKVAEDAPRGGRVERTDQREAARRKGRSG